MTPNEQNVQNMSLNIYSSYYNHTLNVTTYFDPQGSISRKINNTPLNQIATFMHLNLLYCINPS